MKKIQKNVWFLNDHAFTNTEEENRNKTLKVNFYYFPPLIKIWKKNQPLITVKSDVSFTLCLPIDIVQSPT